MQINNDERSLADALSNSRPAIKMAKLAQHRWSPETVIEDRRGNGRHFSR